MKPETTAHDTRSSILGGVAAGALLSTGILWLLSTLFAIANFSFQYPAFDQFHFYPSYFNLEFPYSAIQLENGHRPIFPALVRLTEIEWLGAGQTLQMVVGTCLALFTALAISWVIWRDRSTAAAGAAGFLLCVLAVFWLGNARMLMHSNETVAVYFVTAFTVGALLSTIAAHKGNPLLWLTLAGFLSLCATFSFGAGIACFPAVLLCAIAVRAPSRAIAVATLFFIVAAALYIGWLPGHQGVSGSLLVRPLDNALIGLRWLSSPWVHAWLGLADPPLQSWLQQSVASQPAGGLWTESARLIARLWGDDWLLIESALVGALGVLVYFAMLIHTWQHLGRLAQSHVIALGIASFGLGVGAIICLARANAFATVPVQVFADRYLPWSCLFWLGLGLHLIKRLSASEKLSLRSMAPLLALVFAVLLLPTQRSLAGWSATVHRNIQQSATAAQLGIWDPLRFPDGSDASRSDVETTLAMLRERHLSMFSEQGYTMFVENWQAPNTDLSPLVGSKSYVERRFFDDLGNREVAAIGGFIPRVENRPKNATLVIVDAEGKLRGLANFGAFGANRKALRLNLQQKREFSGYVLDPKNGESLSVLLIDPDDRTIVARIPLEISPT